MTSLQAENLEALRQQVVAADPEFQLVPAWSPWKWIGPTSDEYVLADWPAAGGNVAPADRDLFARAFRINKDEVAVQFRLRMQIEPLDHQDAADIGGVGTDLPNAQHRPHSEEVEDPRAIRGADAPVNDQKRDDVHGPDGNTDGAA